MPEPYRPTSVEEAAAWMAVRLTNPLTVLAEAAAQNLYIECAEAGLNADRSTMAHHLKFQLTALLENLVDSAFEPAIGTWPAEPPQPT